MTKTEAALGRLNTALGKLDTALVAVMAERKKAAAAQKAPKADPERDRLEAEVRALQKRAKQDARLREEAAHAVRDALSDLRTIVAIQNDQGVSANA